MVDPPDQLEVAVGEPAGRRPRLVEPFSRMLAERVRDECRGRQRRSVMIAAGQSHAPYMQRPRTPTGTGRKLRSSTKTRLLLKGRPIGTGRFADRSARDPQKNVRRSSWLRSGRRS